MCIEMNEQNFSNPDATMSFCVLLYCSVTSGECPLLHFTALQAQNLKASSHSPTAGNCYINTFLRNQTCRARQGTTPPMLRTNPRLSQLGPLIVSSHRCIRSDTWDLLSTLRQIKIKINGTSRRFSIDLNPLFQRKMLMF